MNGSTCSQPPTASNRSAALPSSSTGTICDARIRRSAGARRTRLTSAKLWLRRLWPPDAMASSAMNLWTVGCADPRLTAPARSPIDKPGKTQCASPPLPTGRRLPTSFTALRNKTGSIFRGMIKPAAGYRPLAYSSPEAVQTTGTVVFFAQGLLPLGINLAVIECTLAPADRLDRIVAEVRRSVRWLAEHLA